MDELPHGRDFQLSCQLDSEMEGRHDRGEALDGFLPDPPSTSPGEKYKERLYPYSVCLMKDRPNHHTTETRGESHEQRIVKKRDADNRVRLGYFVKTQTKKAA